MIIFLILLITIPAIAGEKESPGITITKGLTRKSYDGMDVDTVNKRFVDALSPPCPTRGGGTGHRWRTGL